MLKRNRNTDNQIDLIKEAFKVWKEKYKEERNSDWLIHDNPAQLNEFRKVWSLIMAEMYKELENNRNGVQLLYFLGDLYIGEIKNNTKQRKFNSIMNGDKIYYKSLNKLGSKGKLIHSIGKKNSYKNHELFKFKPCRKLERLVKAIFLKKPSFFKEDQEKAKRYKP